MISKVESAKNITQEVIAVIGSLLVALQRRVGVFDLGNDRDFLLNGTVADKGTADDLNPRL